MTTGKAWLSVSLVKKLKKQLEKSKYSQIFNYGTFDKWTRSQILEPINDMVKLLDYTLKKHDEATESLKKQISQTDKPELSIPLETQLKRLELQRKPFESMQNQWL